MSSAFRREYTLRQDTPLIHFQHDQAGACLRASEVKPQLDRFILGRFGGEAKMRNDPQMVQWFLSAQHPALHYKMTIRALGEPEKSTEIEDAKSCIRACGRILCGGFRGHVRDTGKCGISCPGYRVIKPIGKSYFANMVALPREMSADRKIEAVTDAFKETVLYRNGLKLTIVCFIEGLQTAIAENIAAFFLLHNFGTRNNKGFGSFCVTKCNDKLLQYSPRKVIVQNSEYPVYCVTNVERNNMMLLDYARELYKLMKSGVNQQGDYFRAFIYQYMHRLTPPIGNEKAWLKKNGVVPIVARNSQIQDHEHSRFNSECIDDYKYVRAMLGVGNAVEYINDIGSRKIKVNISRYENNKVVENFRFSSPIVFKIVDGQLYIIARPVDSDMFGKEFQFSSERGSAILKTPDSFNMQDFIDQFVLYIRENCDSHLYDTNKTLTDAYSIKFQGSIERCCE